MPERGPRDYATKFGALAEALVARLREFQPLQEVILLGDILDLQLAN